MCMSSASCNPGCATQSSGAGSLTTGAPIKQIVVIGERRTRRPLLFDHVFKLASWHVVPCSLSACPLHVAVGAPLSSFSTTSLPVSSFLWLECCGNVATCESGATNIRPAR